VIGLEDLDIHCSTVEGPSGGRAQRKQLTSVLVPRDSAEEEFVTAEDESKGSVVRQVQSAFPHARLGDRCYYRCELIGGVARNSNGIHSFVIKLHG